VVGCPATRTEPDRRPQRGCSFEISKASAREWGVMLWSFLKGDYETMKHSLPLGCASLSLSVSVSASPRTLKTAASDSAVPHALNTADIELVGEKSALAFVFRDPNFAFSKGGTSWTKVANGYLASSLES